MKEYHIVYRKWTGYKIKEETVCIETDKIEACKWCDIYNKMNNCDGVTEFYVIEEKEIS